MQTVPVGQVRDALTTVMQGRLLLIKLFDLAPLPGSVRGLNPECNSAVKAYLQGIDIHPMAA